MKHIKPYRQKKSFSYLQALSNPGPPAPHRNVASRNFDIASKSAENLAGGILVEMGGGISPRIVYQFPSPPTHKHHVWLFHDHVKTEKTLFTEVHSCIN